MSKYGVQGFPTILLFGSDKENPTPYEGARDASSIVNFALVLKEAHAIPPEVVELTGQVMHRRSSRRKHIR
jgi:protein disulfide-isomerase A6